MSLTPKLNRSAVVGGIAALALIGGGIAFAAQSGDDDSSGPTIRPPSKSLDHIDSTTPAETAVAVSRRLYASSPVVMVADAVDKESQELAMSAAETLSVPVLLDGPSTADEIKRLDASTVLTFGRTGTYDHGRAVTKASVASETARMRKSYDTTDAARLQVFVLTSSASTDAVAAATARNAGATVLELPGGDPRADPEVAKAIAAEP